VLEHCVGVSAGDSLGSVCQIVDVYVLAFGLNALLEIVQDLRHVFPWLELADEDIQECLLHIPYSSDTEGIVKIGNDGDTGWRNEQDICRVGDILIDTGAEITRNQSDLLGGDIDGGLVVGESTRVGHGGCSIEGAFGVGCDREDGALVASINEGANGAMADGY